jgi:hypothetical protein
VLHNFPKTRRKMVADAIPDTGADVTCLPIDDCQDLELFLFPITPEFPTLLAACLAR